MNERQARTALDDIIAVLNKNALLAAFELSATRYGVNQLRYNLRKMKTHGLIEQDGKR
jgi:hypothetical protein